MEGRNLGAGFVANCKHGESQRLRRLPARLVQTTQAQASVAGGPRSLPGMGFGNHVAANARRRGSGALSPFPEQISDGPQVGCRTGIIRAGRLERPRVLPARSYAARGSKARREGISGKVSTRQRRIAPPTRHRALHCRGDRQHRVRRTDSRGRRECGASPRANERETAQRRADLEHGKPPPGPGPPRRLQSGNDGTGRDHLPAPATSVLALSSFRILRRAWRIASRGSETSAKKAQNLLRTGAAERTRSAGPARQNRIADAGNVGTAGVTFPRTRKATASTAPFDHGHRLPCERYGNRDSPERKRPLDVPLATRIASTHRPGAQDSTARRAAVKESCNALEGHKDAE